MYCCLSAWLLGLYITIITWIKSYRHRCREYSLCVQSQLYSSHSLLETPSNNLADFTRHVELIQPYCAALLIDIVPLEVVVFRAAQHAGQQLVCREQEEILVGCLSQQPLLVIAAVRSKSYTEEVRLIMRMLESPEEA